jgi:transposase-like protein
MVVVVFVLRREGMVRGTGRKRRGLEEWKVIVERYDRSELGRQAFCRREGLSATTFDKWRRRVRSEGSKPGFIELTRGAESSGWELEVALPGGVVLRLRG